jgi:hypothetical protein
MKSLVDQMCDSVEEYLSTTADHPQNVVGYLMMMTGGTTHVKGEGALSREELAKRDPGSITGYERHGSYRVSHLHEWLNYLCYEFGMLDILLVPSLIKHYRQFLMSLLLDEEVVERRRRFEERLESMLESKKLRDDFFDISRRFYMSSEPTSEEEKISYIKNMLDKFRKLPLESVNRKRDKLRVWENKMGEIVSEETISKYIAEMARMAINEYLD